MKKDTRTDDVAEEMATQLRVRQGDLPKVVKRAGRKLPGRFRRDAERLMTAEMMAAHPKLRAQIDPKTLKKSRRRINSYLATKDPKTERWHAFLDMLASIAFVVVVVGLGLFFYYLYNGAFE